MSTNDRAVDHLTPTAPPRRPGVWLELGLWAAMLVGVLVAIVATHGLPFKW